ncbi:hypothetical protein OG780_13460 [Streptomyces sp. NBC_00386]|jgi:trans-2,3-dihydro-3-hydroxyanthranilate isomerase|uniref:hypothetical protein n=1 Tax=Streptomyces sp. NBC_00386 TaxID=2975734 RepID=UPI002E206D3C
MRVDVVWWDLDRSHQTVESLEKDLRDGSVEPWHEVKGLRLKLWIADRERGRWGAVMWWDSDVPADQQLPPNRAAELIGYAPDHRTGFDVAAVAEGIDSLGLAFSAGPSVPAQALERP